MVQGVKSTRRCAVQDGAVKKLHFSFGKLFSYAGAR